VPDVPELQDPRQADVSPADERSATAIAKYHCPACGAEAHWNPGKHALICPYCGTESPAELQVRGDETIIVEHDLAKALREVPDSARGWDARKTSVKCQSCHAISVFDPDKVGKRCDFCGSAALVAYEEVKDAFRPESLLPLKISESQARDLIRAWYGRQWFAPNNLNKKAITDTVHAVYLPYWTFDAKVFARWQAQSGTYYTVREGGKTVRKVRWTPASGELSHAFDDELVCASTGMQPGMLRRVEPFPTGTLVPYDPGYLAGWTVERYQIDLVGAAQRSRELMNAKTRAMCSRQVPGDTQRDLRVDATFSDQTFKHILAPVWLLTYIYGPKSYQVVVNGVTGSMAGSRPWSWIKIALLILAILMILVLLND
jgi:Zn finger protein HypA/HybF involved in hydrogenase expression